MNSIKRSADRQCRLSVCFWSRKLGLFADSKSGGEFCAWQRCSAGLWRSRRNGKNVDGHRALHEIFAQLELRRIFIG